MLIVIRISVLYSRGILCYVLIARHENLFYSQSNYFSLMSNFIEKVIQIISKAHKLRVLNKLWNVIESISKFYFVVVSNWYKSTDIEAHYWLKHTKKYNCYRKSQI